MAKNKMESLKLHNTQCSPTK